MHLPDTYTIIICFFEIKLSVIIPKAKHCGNILSTGPLVYKDQWEMHHHRIVSTQKSEVTQLLP